MPLVLAVLIAALFSKGYDMKPYPFIPEPLTGNQSYVRNQADGLVWHQCEHRTIYADTDCSKAVYHAKYLHYFEIGRASLMRLAAYPYREIEASGYIYPIIEIGVHYFSPLFYDDSMWIYTRPGTMERVKLQFDYIITLRGDSNIVCKGFTRHCATGKSGKPTAIDEKTILLWKKFPR